MEHADALEISRSAAAGWSLPRRILFRFLCVYLVLYALPDRGRISIVNSIPYAGLLSAKYIALWQAICPWVGSRFFHLSGRRITYAPTGSGDTTLDYIQVLVFVALALAGALLWSVLDRKRGDYRKLESWLRLLVRYTLAFTLFGYGFVKVFPLQFRPPALMSLVEPWGDFSPMGALWKFMGASIPYIMFAGAAEATSGFLLLFRRTTTLGSLAAFGVLLNVAALNYCYDVPVKLYSTNLLLMAVYLASPDFGRLFNVFVRNRTAAPVDLSAPRFSSRWARVAAGVFQILFVGFTLYGDVFGGWQGYRAAYVTPPRPPIYGLYEVESFTRNGQEAPPLVTDGRRWRRFIAEFPTFVSVQTMNDAITGYAAQYDAARSTLVLNRGSMGSLTYARPDPDHLTLDGVLAGERVSVRLRRIDASRFLLLSRGFHWINEVPFNR